MKLTAIVVIIGLVLLALLKSGANWGMWRTTSHETVNCETSVNSEIPDSFCATILFEEDKYTHTHTHNDGVNKIDVNVSGAPVILETGDMKQLSVDYTCDFHSRNFPASGTIRIEKTLTVLGDKNETEARDMLRAEVIKTIIKKIQEL